MGAYSRGALSNEELFEDLQYMVLVHLRFSDSIEALHPLCIHVYNVDL